MVVSTGWCEIDGGDAFPGEDALVMPGNPDVDLCRRLCLLRGFGGFVLRFRSAYFKSHARDRLLQEHNEGVWGATLHIAPTGPATREKPLTTVCQQPDLVKVLQACHKELVNKLSREKVDFGQALQFSADQIMEACKWLVAVRCSAERSIAMFQAPETWQGFACMRELQKWQERAREASRRLSIFLADRSFARSDDAGAAAQLGVAGIIVDPLGTSCPLVYLERILHELGKAVEDEVFAILRSLATPWNGELKIKNGELDRARSEKHQRLAAAASEISAEDWLRITRDAALAVARDCESDLRVREAWAREKTERQAALAEYHTELVATAVALRKRALLRMDEISSDGCLRKVCELVPLQEAEWAHRVVENLREELMVEVIRRSMRDDRSEGWQTPMESDELHSVFG